MSTRCQIEFKQIRNYKNKKKPVIERRTVYRHSDGYPQNVVSDLKEFLEWNLGRNSDIEYQTANFIYWSKRRYEEDFFNKKLLSKAPENPNLKWSDNQPNGSILHIGFGVCENDEIHGDIEYFYEVIYEYTEKEKYNSTFEIYINVYEVVKEDYSKPIKKENLKLIEKVRIENETSN